jgi:putative ABC transport system ATP-binding protein
MFYNNIIQVENVHRHLAQGGRQLHVLIGISFTVEAGYWLALSGPSGSGKSTLLGILAGIDRPTSGKVFVERIEISALLEGSLARFRNEKIGVVFQSFHLIPTMTALANVEAPLYIHPRRRHARAMAINMLEKVGLGERMGYFPHQLSGGEQQRVAIARALACGPEILLADEPTGNLDTATSKQVLDLLRHLRNQLGLTVIMVTHNLAVAAHADRRVRLAGRHRAARPDLALRELSVSRKRVARKGRLRYNVGRSIGAWRRPASALAWGARGRRFKSSRPDWKPLTQLHKPCKGFIVLPASNFLAIADP